MSQHQLIDTADGSHSLVSSIYNESYHSKHGAIQESRHVFIEAGLDFFQDSYEPEVIRILEIGFGTGLNAYLASIWASRKHQQIDYTGVELHPISNPMAETLNYPEQLGRGSDMFMPLHLSEWNERSPIHAYFTLLKQDINFKNIDYSTTVDIIFYDAFAPAAQADLWTADRMHHMYSILDSPGILVTYCAKGSFKRALKAAGFIVQSINGPIGKREMTRALKQ